MPNTTHGSVLAGDGNCWQKSSSGADRLGESNVGNMSWKFSKKHGIG